MNWIFIKIMFMGCLGTTMGTDEELTDAIERVQRWADINTRPHYAGPKESIHVEFDVDRISLNDTLERMEIDFTMHLTWIDPRVERLALPSVLTLAKELRIWSPSPEFQNGQTRDSGSVTRSSLQIYPDGRISKRTRHLLTSACKINWRYYPMDHQICKLHILDSNDTTYTTKDDSLRVRNVVQADFYLVNASTTLKKSHISTWEKGSVMVSLEFRLNRSPFYIFLNYYLPSIFFVAFSWASFWSCSETNSLGCSLFSLLSVIYFSYTFNWHSIDVDMIIALDVFTLFSLALILLSTWEIFSKRINRRKFDLKKKLDEDCYEDVPLKKSFLALESWIIFPTIYIGFLFIYWIVLFISQQYYTM